jgi:hypothetical protein
MADGQPATATATATTSNAPAQTGAGPTRTPTSSQKQAQAFEPPMFYRAVSQDKPKFLRMMVYSGPGIGKTTLAASACNHDASSDVLLCTAEGGDMVLEDNDRVERPELIDIRMTRKIQEVQKLYEWLSRHCYFRDQNNTKALHQLQNIAFFGNKDITEEEALKIIPDFDFQRIRKYRTLILDSLTDIEALNMNAVLGIGDEGFVVGDDLTPPGYTEFRKNNNTIQQLVRAFRNLPMNIIIICGVKWQQDEQKKFHYGPWMTGQLATQVQSFVDVVGYMVTSTPDMNKPTETVRRLYVQPQAAVKFDAKCRIASFKKPYFEDPTFPDMLRECGFINN